MNTVKKPRTSTSQATLAGKRLKSARMLAGLSRKDLATLYGISIFTIQSWELGRNPLTEKGAQRIVNALEKAGVKCTTDWLLSGSGLPPKPILIDRICYQAKTDENNDIHWDDEIALQKEIEAFYQIHPSADLMMISDDAMLPQYEIGDYIAGVQLKETSLAQAFNRNCIVNIKQGLLFRRFVPYNKQYALIAINPETTVEQPIIITDHVASITPVIWHRKKLIPYE